MPVNGHGELASVHDQETNEFLSTLTQVDSWLGGYQDDQDNWMWSDGSIWNYANWNTNQPDNGRGVEDYLQTNHFGIGLWNDLPVEHPIIVGYICQYDVLKEHSSKFFQESL